MKTLILQHHENCPPGTLITYLNDKKIPCEIVMASQLLDRDIGPDRYDALVVLGGGMDVDQEEMYPWLKKEKSLIRKFIAEDKKILGLCLGGQLLAEVLGAQVHAHSEWEAGWHEVKMENQFLTLFVKPNYKMFQWHGYRFHTPEGATRVASNDTCTDQGFIFKNKMIGLQFHPESTQEWIIDCTEPVNYPEGPQVQSKEQILSQIHLQKDLQKWFFTLLNWWYGQV